MIITNTQINLSATHEMEEQNRELTIRLRINQEPTAEQARGLNRESQQPRQRMGLRWPDNGNQRRIINTQEAIAQRISDLQSASRGLRWSPINVDISHQARIKNLQSKTTPLGPAFKVNCIEQNPFDPKKDPKLQVLIRTLEKLTGKKFRLEQSDVLQHLTADLKSLEATKNLRPEETPAELSRAPQRDTVENSETIRNEWEETVTLIQSSHYERENTGFSARGTVVTADGREIDISVELNMSREFYQSNLERIITINRTSDPLIINWDGKAADLTDTKYSFDLNGDGVKEEISFVRPGSGGILTYDRNGDGVVNDGSELFGPSTGKGFEELAAYDEDGNGAIDQGDAIFHDLAVWSRDEAGINHLVALADTGMGAIYLNALETPFSVKNSKNELLGQVQSTSFYINEDGSVGTIQQVDLTVDETDQGTAADASPPVESFAEEQIEEPTPEVSEDHTETAESEQENSEDGREEEV